MADLEKGDWVWFDEGDSSRLLGKLDQWEEGSWSIQGVSSNDWHEEYCLSLVAVSEAFEMAGHPVPEGAKLVRQVTDVHGLFWTAATSEATFFFGEKSKGSPEDGWRPLSCIAINNGALIDLSDTPVSRAENAVPEIVRKALTSEGVGGGK